MAKKKLTKIEGLKKSEFDVILKDPDANPKEITVQKTRLIPVAKQGGSEMALTSIFLSALRLVKEFREMFFSKIGITQKMGRIYTYTEVNFAKYKEKDDRPDGMLLQVTVGKIKKAILFEIKNKSNTLQQDQIENYIKVAKEYGISKIVTISNEFVSKPTQSPLKLKVPNTIEIFHFSWSHILTMAHILLFDNESNIDDEDQVEIMREIVSYFEHEISGVFGFTRMKKGWKEAITKLDTSSKISRNDKDILDAVASWQQEEKDLALILSRKLGLFVKTGLKKYKNNLQGRIDEDVKNLIDKKELISIFKIKGCVSDLKIRVAFDTKYVRMEVRTNVTQDKKTIKGQLSWFEKHIIKAKSINCEKFKKLEEELNIEINVKNTKGLECHKWNDYDKFYDELKDGKRINDFRVILNKHFGKGNFASPTKFIEIIEKMIIDYYQVIVQNLKNWKKPEAKPKIKDSTEVEI
ncbi:MAG: hypothetical protein PF638_12920 [Candidatus Delongbacteria bacterium]|jgi:hypothetical protein|nr:hypothetical protein [Candidatus Delongbacteria bacterium]